MPLDADALIVVTGGAGFIGANTVAALNARGHENIVVVDRLGTDEKWKNLLELKISNFVDKDEYIAMVRERNAPEPEAIFHLGACSATTERDADFLMANNFQYTRQLCYWALECGARFIHASSAATYGDGSLGYRDEDRDTPKYRPLNMYGMSKQLLDEWALRRGFYEQMVGLKFFNVYGPREAHKGDMRSVAHKAYQEVKAKGHISLFESDHPDYADGEQKRDFVWVGDAVAMMLWFLDHPEVNGLFNCGTGRAQTWLELARAIFAAMGREERINWVPLPEALRGKYQYFTEADLTKLRTAGYRESFTPLAEGIRQYVQWLDAGNP